MESYIKKIIENESRLGEMRGAQLENIRNRFGKRIYAVSLAKLRKTLEPGKEYDLLVLPSRVNVMSLYGQGYNFNSYNFESAEDLENFINQFHYYNCSRETGSRVNVYVRDEE